MENAQICAWWIKNNTHIITILNVGGGTNSSVSSQVGARRSVEQICYFVCFLHSVCCCVSYKSPNTLPLRCITALIKHHRSVSESWSRALFFHTYQSLPWLPSTRAATAQVDQFVSFYKSATGVEVVHNEPRGFFFVYLLVCSSVCNALCARGGWGDYDLPPRALHKAMRRVL